MLVSKTAFILARPTPRAGSVDSSARQYSVLATIQTRDVVGANELWTVLYPPTAGVKTQQSRVPRFVFQAVDVPIVVGFVQGLLWLLLCKPKFNIYDNYTIF
jgi:hypothetical protein